VRKEFNKEVGNFYEILQVCVEQQCWGQGNTLSSSALCSLAGIGSTLLNHVIAMSEVDKVPILTNSSVDRTVEWLMDKFGFKVYKQIPRAEGIHPRLTFLHRDPVE
jgi:hypothetical protein